MSLFTACNFHPNKTNSKNIWMSIAWASQGSSLLLNLTECCYPQTTPCQAAGSLGQIHKTSDLQISEKIMHVAKINKTNKRNMLALGRNTRTTSFITFMAVVDLHDIYVSKYRTPATSPGDLQFCLMFLGHVEISGRCRRFAAVAEAVEAPAGVLILLSSCP